MNADNMKELAAIRVLPLVRINMVCLKKKNGKQLIL